MKRAQRILSNHKSAKVLPVPDFSAAGSASYSTKIPAGGLKAAIPDHFVSRPIASTNPNTQQWPPTEDDPYRQHHRMAGMEN